MASSVETAAPVRSGTPYRVEITPFKNEPFLDFTRAENQRRMKDAITKVRSQLGRDWDLVIGGERYKKDKKFTSINPSNPVEIIGTFQNADATDVPKVMDAALRA